MSKKPGYAGSHQGKNRDPGPTSAQSSEAASSARSEHPYASKHDVAEAVRAKGHDQNRSRAAHREAQANAKSSVANSNKNPGVNGDWDESKHPRDATGKFG